LKKIAFYMLFIALFVLGSCQQEEVPTVINCGDGEILVDDVCIKEKSDFEKTFDATDLMTNYTLTISIQQSADLYEMTMMVDGSKSSFEMDDQTEFFEKQGSMIDRYYPVGEGYRKESITQTENDSFHFFKDLEASWFQTVSGKYFLKTDYNDEVADFFQGEFPGSTVSNLELIVGDTYFEQIIFDVTVDSVMYRFTMTLSAVGTTTVTLPTV